MGLGEGEHLENTFVSVEDDDRGATVEEEFYHLPLSGEAYTRQCTSLFQEHCQVVPFATASFYVEDNDAHYLVDSGVMFSSMNDDYNQVISAQLVPDCDQGPLFHRPEFLYIDAIKPSPESSIGVSFRKSNNDGFIYIGRVCPYGLFGKSGLQVGDKVIAVNKVDISNFALQEILDMIKASHSKVSFCLQNEGGHPHSVLTSIQKPSRHMKLGLVFRNSRGALTINHVLPHGLISDTLIMSGHRCHILNGVFCDNMPAQEAADLTASADRVTLVSQPRCNLAAVLSVGEGNSVREETNTKKSVLRRCLSHIRLRRSMRSHDATPVGNQSNQYPKQARMRHRYLLRATLLRRRQSAEFQGDEGQGNSASG